MPIREYGNRDDALAIGEGGAAVTGRAAVRAGVLGREQGEMTRGAGRDLQVAFHQLGEGVQKDANAVETWQTNKELSDGNAALMNKHKELDDSWNKLRGEADPNIPVGDNWRAGAFAELDKMMDGVSTKGAREHMQASINRAKEHYLHSTRADDMAAAGDGAVRNLQTVVNGATLRSANDFSTVGYNSQLIRDTVEASIKNGSFSPAQQIKLRDAADKFAKENSLAGLKGAADRNPAAFSAQLKAGKYDGMEGLDAHSKDQLLQYARAHERAQKADARNAAIDAEIATQKQSEAHLQRILNGTRNPDGTENWPKIQDVWADPKLTAEHRKFLTGVLTAREREPALKGNPEVFNNLYRGISDPKNPTSLDDITDAVTDPDRSKRITPADAKALGKKLIDTQNNPVEKQWHEAEKTAVSDMRKSAGLDGTTAFDPGAPYMVSAAAQYVRERFAEAKVQGVKARDLLDPNSKDYYLRDPVLQKILSDPKAYQPKNVKQNPPLPGTPDAPKPASPIADFFGGMLGGKK